MKAIVLAAGKGSRISEITRYIPKTMIEINGRYIFSKILEELKKVGIQDVIFVVGYKHTQLIPAIKEECKMLSLNISFVVNEEYNKTNTMYSLWLAREQLQGPFVYLHGDLLFGYKMLQELLDSDESNAVLVDKKFPLDWEDAMKIISHDDEIKYMSKAITVNEMDGIAIGIYKFDARGAKELFRISEELIKKNVIESWISESINILVKTIKIGVVLNSAYSWIDVDNLKDLDIGKTIQKKISNE